ncbi:MAG: bifunctional diaminohydroxyphosphoribosylaminopyrimidine deaminase/5-amino-6-(5-phosphoribosylamino)uracil reductase RibD [Fibrobacterota bacterium]
MTDYEYMRRAVRKAWQVKGLTAPNPAVGALIIKDGSVLGSGATAPAGGDHAEVAAIKDAGVHNCKDATLYVTLEPCCHHGKTPPCTDAIIHARISRVVYALTDPNPQVRGSGARQLAEAGIEVTTDVASQEAYRVNEDFFYYIQHKKCWVSLKIALTLDGAIADTTGKPKWITREASRKKVHQLRACHTAIAVGAATLRMDNPRLTVRDIPGKNPVRIVFSRSGSIHHDSYFYTHAHEVRTIIVCAGGEAGAIVKESGPEYWYTGETALEKMVPVFLSRAYAEGIDSLFVEGGSILAQSFLQARCVNRVYLFYAPRILGGGKKLFTASPVYMEEARELQQVEYIHLGKDLLVTGLL